MGKALLRWGLPLALAVLTVVDAAATGAAGFPEPVAAAVVLLVAASLVLARRRERPVLTAIVASALVTAYLVLLHGDLATQPALEPFLVMCVAFFSLGLHSGSDALPLGLTAAGLPLVAVEMTAVAAGRPLGDVFPTLLFWAAAVVLGRLLHRRTQEATAAQELAAAERERAVEARRQAEEAATAERSRIARELHDVVAHSLSVVVLHAGVERRLMEDQDSSTGRALATIEDTARTALAELRHLLGLLRQDDETPLAPLPSLDEVDGLVATLRSSGHEVRLDVTGDAAGLPAGIDLSAYRIVQEAVTNTLRHAPGSAVAVRVAHEPDAVLLEVVNQPATPAATEAGAGAVSRTAPSSTMLGSGRGLVGMRERVRLYGGDLAAGPTDDGGFRVHARLPRAAG